MGPTQEERRLKRNPGGSLQVGGVETELSRGLEIARNNLGIPGRDQNKTLDGRLMEKSRSVQPFSTGKGTSPGRVRDRRHVWQGVLCHGQCSEDARAPQKCSLLQRSPGVADHKLQTRLLQWLSA